MGVFVQSDLDKEVSHLLGHFNRIMHKFMQCFKSLEEQKIESALKTASSADLSMAPVSQSIDEELVISALKADYVYQMSSSLQLLKKFRQNKQVKRLKFCKTPL